MTEEQNCESLDKHFNKLNISKKGKLFFSTTLTHFRENLKRESDR